MQPHHHPQKGFTLLEMIIAMMVVSILLTGAVLFLKDTSEKEVITLARETQVLAKETLNSAKNNSRAYAIHISPERIWAAADTVEDVEQSDLSAEQKTNSALNIPEGMRVSYQLNPEDSWIEIRRKADTFTWAFSKSGLCEAISLRFDSDDALYETSFHALTAGELNNE